MLTLPPFEHHAPATLAEAVALLDSLGPGAQVLAGGTDLLPNMKHRVATPAHLVSLQRVRELRGIADEAGGVTIGAMTSLSELAASPRVAAVAPSLVEAAGQVAGPQLRAMGTLGGNVCLDTRCVYVNQTYFWRQALGFCLKKDGTVCHVVQGGQACVAAASNDTATALCTLGARVRLWGPNGAREVAIDRFYVPDGVKNTVLEPGELVIGVHVPAQPADAVGAYQKLRVRAAIDYPALSVAVWARREGDVLREVRVCISALAARPHLVRRLEGFADRPFDLETCDAIGEAARRQCHPLTNLDGDPAWRRSLIRVLVRRALVRAGNAARLAPGGKPV